MAEDMLGGGLAERPGDPDDRGLQALQFLVGLAPIAALYEGLLRRQCPHGEHQHERHRVHRDQPPDRFQIERREAESDDGRVEKRDGENALRPSRQDQLFLRGLPGIALAPGRGQKEAADDRDGDPAGDARQEIGDHHQHQDAETEAPVVILRLEDPFQESERVVFLLLESVQVENQPAPGEGEKHDPDKKPKWRAHVGVSN